MALTGTSPLLEAAPPVNTVGVSPAGRSSSRSALKPSLSLRLPTGAPEPWFPYHSIGCALERWMEVEGHTVHSGGC